MPYLLSSAFNTMAPTLVSENTLKKIKVARKSEHEDMWTHIDKQIVEKKYGGTMANIQKSFWPPSKNLMNYVSASSSNNLKTKKQYQRLFQEGKLARTKVKKELVAEMEATPSPQSKNMSIAQNHVKNSLSNSQNNVNNLENVDEQLQLSSAKSSKLKQFDNSQSIVGKDNEKTNEKINVNSYSSAKNSIQDYLPAERIKKEILVPIKKRQFKLFFEDEKFLFIFDKNGLIKQ